MLTAVPDADVEMSFGSDAAVTDETCRRLTNSNPDVMWMLLLDVDSAGHASGWGPTVSNYVRAIEIADGRVGQITSARRATRRRLQMQMIFFLLDGREGPARRLTDLCVRLAGLPFFRADKNKRGG